MSDERNEFSPRERGLLIGHLWAAAAACEHLRPVADGDVTPELRELVERQLVYSDDIENPTAFWDGFVHGVRSLVVELRLDIERRSES